MAKGGARMMDIIKRLHKLETFQKGEGDEYGAEVLANAQKEITDLRAQLERRQSLLEEAVRRGLDYQAQLAEAQEDNDRQETTLDLFRTEIKDWTEVGKVATAKIEWLEAELQQAQGCLVKILECNKSKYSDSVEAIDAIYSIAYYELPENMRPEGTPNIVVSQIGLGEALRNKNDK